MEHMKMHDKNKKFAGQIIQEEQGVVLVTALLFMVVLTIMGTASMLIRNTEQQITRNSEIFQHNFYTLEAVTLEGATAIDNTPDTVLSTPASYPGWLRVEDPANAALNLMTNVNWPSGSITPLNTNLNTSPTDIRPTGYASDGTVNGDRIWYSALDTLDVNGDARCDGSSLTDPTKVEKCYEVYGMYDMKQGAGKAYTGKMMLQVGYKKVVYL